jgi:hypothetical protein
MTATMTTAFVEEIERETSTEGIASIARYLQDQLGQKTVAYLAGIRDPKMVGRWAAGKNSPAEMTTLRLRAAFEITRLLSAAYNAETAKAWLFGSNSRLDGEAPAYLIRYANSWDDLRPIVPTARAFAGGAD